MKLYTVSKIIFKLNPIISFSWKNQIYRIKTFCYVWFILIVLYRKISILKKKIELKKNIFFNNKFNWHGSQFIIIRNS